MKKIISIFVMFAVQFALAQEQDLQEVKEPSKTTFAIDIKHNSVAGFYPVFLGSTGLSENVDLTFYSIFWANSAFGNLQTGSDLFLETGVGLGFKLADDKLFINPTLGFAHGKFLSGSNETLLAEGLIPNLFTLYNTEWFEFEAYLAYYKAIRKGEGPNRDFLLNWIVPGVKVSKKFSFGAYYEQFVLTRRSDDLQEQSIYQWLGGYVKLTLNNGIWFRFAAGPNLYTDAGTSKEFYKVQAFIPL
ncbi:MAG: DUF6733 family protein [Bacteroidota bacterium]